MIQTELKLRTVAEFLSEPEARLVECVLAMQGIPCILKSTRAFGTYEAIGVTVQVADGNWEAAQAVLHEHHEHRQSKPSWSCAVCGADVIADFDTCWQCGAERGSTAKATLVAPTLPEPDLPDETPNDQDLRCAWRGSLLGLYFPWGLFNAYSMWLLFRIDYRALVTTSRFKFKTAFALDLLSIAGWGLVHVVAMNARTLFALDLLSIVVWGWLWLNTRRTTPLMPRTS